MRRRQFLLTWFLIGACRTFSPTELNGDHERVRVMHVILKDRRSLVVYDAKVAHDSVFGHNLDRDSVAIETSQIARAEVGQLDGPKTVFYITLSIVALIVLTYTVMSIAWSGGT